mgnify:CR=1 FL=1
MDKKLYEMQCKINEYIARYPDIDSESYVNDNVYSINPSFFLELFVNVVRKLGKDGFLKKFNFKSEGHYKYETPLMEAIDRILRNNNALQ